MIKGIGTDIAKVNRFLKISERLKVKVFTQNEIKYLEGKHVESMAGMFAAKEAVIKILGASVFYVHDVEILHDEKNAPYVKLHDASFNIARALDITQIKISISHEKDFAIAMAVAT